MHCVGRMQGFSGGTCGARASGTLGKPYVSESLATCLQADILLNICLSRKCLLKPQVLGKLLSASLKPPKWPFRIVGPFLLRAVNT
jgi:hypothetical protein